MEGGDDETPTVCQSSLLGECGAILVSQDARMESGILRSLRRPPRKSVVPHLMAYQTLLDERRQQPQSLICFLSNTNLLVCSLLW